VSSERSEGVTPEGLHAALAQLELRIVREIQHEIQKVRDVVLSELRVREIVRDELDEHRSAEWSVRSRFVAVTLFFTSVSTFLITFFR
jgi:hypothetical protein